MANHIPNESIRDLQNLAFLKLKSIINKLDHRLWVRSNFDREKRNLELEVYNNQGNAVLFKVAEESLFMRDSQNQICSLIHSKFKNAPTLY